MAQIAFRPIRPPAGVHQGRLTPLQPHHPSLQGA